MSAPVRDVTCVSYRVSWVAKDRLVVTAHVTPAAEVTVLRMRDAFGPACGFAERAHDVVVAPSTATMVADGGDLLVISQIAFTLEYEIRLGTYVDAVSPLRGFQRGGALFAPGMALFYLPPDPVSVTVEIAIEGEVVTSWSADSAWSSEWPRTHVRLDSAAALEQTYFACGELATFRSGRTVFVHEGGFPFVPEGLKSLWAELCAEVLGMFGESDVPDWSVFLFACADCEPGRPGIGFALPSAALVSVSSGDDELASPHTLWLMLHEFAHQWLGENLRRSAAADDWFFEGFTSFIAFEALQRSGVVGIGEMAAMLRLSRAAVRARRCDGGAAMSHAGLLAAWRWHRVLGRRNSSLPSVLGRLLATCRGQTLGGRMLLDALARSSPDAALPAFVRRLAMGAKPCDD